MNETQFRREVQVMCEGFGLLWHHCNDTRSCSGPKGLPDLIIIGPGGVLVPELKTENGDTSAEQDLWLWNAGRYGRVWRPADLDSGLIRTELERLLTRCAS
jgi:hypothetical protein